MDQLFPRFATGVDPAALYASDHRAPRPDRPWLMLNMVTSIDGATSAEGVSGNLSGPEDREVFVAIRAVADFILVGAETVRRERYRPPRILPEMAGGRTARGQAPRPRLAVVSRSLDLDFTTPLFDDHPPPMLFTVTDPSADRLAEAEAVAEVHRLGADRVDLGEALRRMGPPGACVVLAEGGPSLNGQLLAAGLVDEVCWTISPTLAGGDTHRMTKGAPPRLDRLRLVRVLTKNDTLFLRYLTR